ncbi:MAG: ATP-binding cassette domain-containing protein [Sulfitobacter sp.]|nr:ATP-binding cassette domain-containing protein [Sulfitobacter sp.]MCP4085357.1 ATP-binding cassette domain-containing protein [Actinomycetes bacterium]
MLIVDGIAHGYEKGQEVLRDVSFTFGTSGLLALVGASGSGKSTLLGILGGAIGPTAGSYSFGHEAKSFSWLFQTPNVLGHRTAVENVALGMVCRRSEWRSCMEEAKAALARYGLGHRERAKARELSGGETQRLVLARAEVAQSQVLLADEPTGQLDFENTRLVAAALRQLADAGALVVVATHDPAVSELADGVVSITNGVATYVESESSPR